MTPEPFVSVKEVAQFLRMAPRTISRMARQGRIPAHPVSGSIRRTWRFKLSEIGLFFESHAPTSTIEDERPNPAERRQQ
jgi:excisionase family DNA binding protein